MTPKPASSGGRAWVFGDDVDTDLLAPGAYMKLSFEAAAAHCLEAVSATFASEVRPGDIVVAGDNFGMGSSREGAAQSLKLLGVSAVLAKGFGRIFYRNALNIGLVALFMPRAAEIRDGDRLAVDAVEGRVVNLDSQVVFPAEPIPAHLMAMVADGGLVPHLKRRFQGGQA